MPRADHSFRGVLPGMSVYLDVCDLETPTVKRSRPGWTVALQKERAGIEESSG